MDWKLTSRRRAWCLALVALFPFFSGCGNKSGGDETTDDAGMAGVGGDAGTDAAGSGGQSGAGGDTYTCGDGVVDQGEDCDDQNDDPTDGCGNDCLFTCEQTVVGDQKCNDGNFCNGKETCGTDHKCLPGQQEPDMTRCGQSHVCLQGVCQHLEQSCGDGIVTGTEQCEGANDVNGDGCDTDCMFSCENVTDGRPCEPPTTCLVTPLCDDTTHTCSYQQLADLTPCNLDAADPTAGTGACINGVCETKYCGNGATESDLGEECDDGNQASGDGCEPDCHYSCLSSDSTRDCTPTSPCFVSAGCNETTHMCPATTIAANGTACGSSLVCIYGNCYDSFCGDGAVDAAMNEQCDDGNNVNGDGCDTDCTFSCSTASDCTGTLPSTCLQWACGTNHRCAMAADGSKDGQSCGTGGTCTSGACTAGTCGNGTLDAGEQCDDGNTVSGDGCEPYCVYSCQVNTDCNNGEACDGTEVCRNFTATNTKKCAISLTGPALADGTSCGTSGGICEFGVCRQSFCGDGYTDTTSGEECEPPNTRVCDASCHSITTCNLSGTWATHILVEVSWSSQFLVPSGQVPPGTHYLEQYVLVNITHDPTSTTPLLLDETLVPCGLSTPDFATVTTIGNGDVYGTYFPDSIWDNGVPSVTTTGALGGLTPGSTFKTDATAVITGITLANPFDSWPLTDTIDQYNAVVLMGRDDDEDTHPGITVSAKVGALPTELVGLSDTGTYEDFVNNQNDISNLGRADRLYLAVRQRSSQIGTIDSDTCDHVSGSLSGVAIDNHIVGCHKDEATSGVTGGTECTPDEGYLVDFGRPRFKAVSSTFESKKLATGATCVDVRNAFQ